MTVTPRPAQADPRSMPAEVASRELRNNGLLRRVQAGEDITITANGKPVALLTAGSPHGADG
ncbi:prevent-host-death family protein [Mycobacterium tuberculosis]|uniref:type II toxin-antitoxin system Phd/YefM family antitoxin n=1 Tax=Mycobacterium tuberculosis TaxID=1773 RepID=UPI0005E55695|nr:type II toxin-antitoxin system prevent-host-death family antitoxin [Mycobacterium tuberculosis]CKU79761.1 prevent-host-death family protein [Mycobacterium tuberculosis]